jgi:hypothetical protein
MIDFTVQLTRIIATPLDLDTFCVWFILQEVRSSNLTVDFGAGPVIVANALVFPSKEAAEALQGRHLEPVHMLVQVVWTNKIYNHMPILIQDDSNDILYLRDAITNCIQWPKKGMQLEEVKLINPIWACYDWK